jgi:hypothetical protein
VNPTCSQYQRYQSYLLAHKRYVAASAYPSQSSSTQFYNPCCNPTCAMQPRFPFPGMPPPGAGPPGMMPPAMPGFPPQGYPPAHGFYPPGGMPPPPHMMHPGMHMHMGAPPGMPAAGMPPPPVFNPPAYGVPPVPPKTASSVIVGKA